MVEKIIEEKVSNLTITEINSFAKENDVILNTEELNSILEIIQNNWYDLIYGDSKSIFCNNRSKLSDNNYIKIKKLFYFFKKKYQKFL